MVDSILNSPRFPSTNSESTPAAVKRAERAKQQDEGREDVIVEGIGKAAAFGFSGIPAHVKTQLVHFEIMLLPDKASIDDCCGPIPFEVTLRLPINEVEHVVANIGEALSAFARYQVQLPAC